jgi:DNA-binding IclR family transcriptional regulator
LYHSTALGKAFMAGWDAPMRQTIYRSCGLPRQTTNTITEIDALEAQLAQFRAQGYALDVEENEIGVNGIARWILDGLGEVAAAISVSGHSSRLTEEVMEHIAPDVINAADSIAVAIGGSESADDRVATGRR